MRYPRAALAFRALVTMLLLLGVCSAQQPAPLPPVEPSSELSPRIETILSRSPAARAFWGVEIEELDTGRVLYSRNADLLFEPASNAKLFTTAAALALLGPGYRMRTTVEAATAPDKDGRITGDLVLVGRGDPNLSGRALPYALKTERPYPPTRAIDELANQLVARGIKTLDGDVIGDDSYFADEPYAPGWSNEDVTALWGTPVSALAINDNVVYLDVKPGVRAGERAAFTLSPTPEYYHVDNRVLTAPEGSMRAIATVRRPGSHQVELRGSIALDDPGYGEALAIDQPAEWAALLLRDALVQRGVVVHGTARARHQLPPALNSVVSPASTPADSSTPAPVAPQRSVLAEHVSLPLSADIRVTNKVSQNLHAEMLLRLLGHEKGSGGSLAGGLDVLRRFISGTGIAPDDFALYDGSGLSRHDLVSPHAVVKLLRYAAGQSWGAEFIDSLPEAGVDGTLAARMQTLPPGTIVHAKTGSLEHVNVLSGYLTTAGGRRVVFSMMVNNCTLPSRQIAALLDQIVVATERSIGQTASWTD